MMPEEPQNREYLGDGVYIRSDGSLLCLTAENGIRATDTIYLEPEVFRALVTYAKRVRIAADSESSPAEPALVTFHAEPFCGWEEFTVEEKDRAHGMEASSIRYVIGLRLALLTTGKWAVYYSLDQSSPRGMIEIMDQLEEKRLRELASLDAQTWRVFVRKEKEMEEQRNLPRSEKASKSLEDMGL